MERAVADNAILFWDYKEYARYCAKLFHTDNEQRQIKADRVACLEFGVSTGATINLLSSALPEYQFFGFDSFDGFASVQKGSIWADFDKRFKAQTAPKINSNVQLITGYVEKTFPPFAAARLREVDGLFIHLDMDVYEPTRVVLDWLQKSGKRAFVMFDELINYEEFHLHEYRALLETIVETKVPYRVRALCDRGQNVYGQFGKAMIEVG